MTKLYTRSLIIFFLLFGAATANAQTADFTADIYSGCAPLAVTFTDKSAGTSTGTIYSWDFGDSKVSTLKDPSTTYGVAGTYTVRLIVKNGASGTPSTKTATIIVYPVPSVNFSALPFSGCPCISAVFKNTTVPNTAGAYTSIWSFGDGNTSLATDPTNLYCLPGKYDVSLKVTNSAGCNSSKTTAGFITVFERPDITFSASKTTLCKLPDSTTFTATVSGGKAPYSYAWNFGDLGISSLAKPTHKYLSSGIYSVRLIVTDANGCQDTLLRPDYIIAKTVSDFTAYSVCIGSVSSFINTSYPTPVSSSWSFGDSYTATGVSVNHEYKSSGIYTVRLINTYAGGCIDTLIKVYEVHPKPKARFSYGPIYPCPAPATIDFVNKSSGATKYLWLFGDGSTSTSADVAHTYMHDSIYIVYLIAKSDFGCADTFRVRDTSKVFPGGYPKPYYDSTNSPVIIRVYSGDTKISVNYDSGCLTVPVNVSVKLLTHTYLPIASDTCYNRATGYGLPFWPCNAIPKSDPYPDPYYDPPHSYYPAPAPYPVPVKTYFWDFGDGFTSTLSSPSHIYTTEGRYWVKLRIVTDSGCVFIDSIQIARGLKPIADFEMTDSVCKHTNVKFVNTSSNALGFRWCFGDVPCTSYFTDGSTPWYHSYHICDDTIRIVLVAYRYGCIDQKEKVLKFKPGDAFPGISYSCDSPLKVTFNSLDCRISSVRWDFGDGDTSVVKSPVTHRYASFGTYTVSRISRNDTSGCVANFTGLVKLNDTRPDFTATDTTICMGDEVTFTVTAKTFFMDYWWIINKKVFYDEVGRISYRFTDTGSYSITLVARDEHLCMDTLVKKNYIIVGKPITEIYANPLISCSPLKSTFLDSSIDTKGTYIVSRSWNWGDGSATDTAKSLNHTFNDAGVYKVQLMTIDNIGCRDTAGVVAEVRKPVASFVTSVDTFGCIGANITFYNKSSGTDLSYYWDFGDGTHSTDISPSHSYGYLGAYTVRLWIKDGIGCKDSTTKTDFIKLTKPTASFKLKDTLSLCPPLFDTLTNTSTLASSYFWDFGNSSSSVLKDPVATYTDSGKYTIVLVAYNEHGCTDTARAKVRVLGYDGAIKYGPLLGCAPFKVSFDIEQFNAAVMLLDYADGVTENVLGKKKVTHTYMNPGFYVPQLIFGDGGACRSFSRGLDTIRIDAVTARFVYTPACVGTAIEFTDSSTSLFSGYYSSLWMFDGETAEFGRTILHTYPAPGIYQVKLYSKNDLGCFDSMIKDVTVYPLPVITTKDTIICLGDAVQLAAGGAEDYTWKPDPSLSCSDCKTPIAKPEETTDYIVTGTDINGCKNIDTVRVGIKTKATVITADSAETCERKPLKLLATGAERYSWSPETYLDSPYIARPVATMDTSIIYRVIGFEAACIPDTAYVRILVHPLPEVNAGPDQRILAGTVAQLAGTARYAKTYLWTPAAQLSCATCPDPKLTARSSILFTLKATSDYGCTDSDDVQITVFCDNSQLYMANTFTPNGDGQNDYFYPQGMGLGEIRSFLIYNRWGQKMYERKNFAANVKESGWDGSFHGEQLNPDTYVYTLEITCEAGETIFVKGDITLLR